MSKNSNFTLRPFYYMHIEKAIHIDPKEDFLTLMCEKTTHSGSCVYADFTKAMTSTSKTAYSP